MRAANLSEQHRKLVRHVATLIAVASAVGGVIYGKNAVAYVAAAVSTWNPIWSLAESFRSWDADTMKTAFSHFPRWSTPLTGGLGRGGAIASLVAAVPLLVALVVKCVHRTAQIASSWDDLLENIGGLCIGVGLVGMTLVAMGGYVGRSLQRSDPGGESRS